MNRIMIALMGMVAIAAALLASPVGAQEGAGASTLTVRGFVCPVSYTGSNYVDDCPGEADLSVIVSLDASEFAVDDITGDDGSVTFADLGDGAYTVTLDVPGDFNDFETVCSVPGEIEPRQIRNANSNRIGVDLSNGVNLYCSFYIKPIDARGVDGATSLPDTGVGGRQSISALFIAAGAVGLGSLIGGTVIRRKRA
jgi:hypothetical protein